MEPIDILQVKKLKFANGVLYFDGAKFTEVHLRHIKTKEGIEKIDLMLLQFYFSIILDQFYTKLKKGELDPTAATILPITIYVPDLIRKLGEYGHFDQQKAEEIGNKTFDFQGIIGVMRSIEKPQYKNYFPVLIFRGYEGAPNTITFESPYLEYLIRAIYRESIRTTKHGKPQFKKDGTPELKPSYSYLVKPALTFERNKAAAENVLIITTLIEQAGGNGAHISAQTLIERNPVLEQRLKSSRNPVQLLQRVFKRTWKLLRDQTRLMEVYEEIELPDPNDTTNIPTPSNLREHIFEFTHKGKKKNIENNIEKQE